MASVWDVHFCKWGRKLLNSSLFFLPGHAPNNLFFKFALGTSLLAGSIYAYSRSYGKGLLGLLLLLLLLFSMLSVRHFSSLNRHFHSYTTKAIKKFFIHLNGGKKCCWLIMCALSHCPCHYSCAGQANVLEADKALRRGGKSSTGHQIPSE